MRLSNIKERAMQGVFFLTALAGIAAVVLICIFLFYNGVPAMAEMAKIGEGVALDRAFSFLLISSAGSESVLFKAMTSGLSASFAL